MGQSLILAVFLVLGAVATAGSIGCGGVESFIGEKCCLSATFTCGGSCGAVVP